MLRGQDVVLAVVFRQRQWALDGTARDVRTLTADRAAELAVLLADTASLVRHAKGVTRGWASEVNTNPTHDRSMLALELERLQADTRHPAARL